MTTMMMMMMIVDWIGNWWKKLIAIIGLHPTIVTTYQATEPPERFRENSLFSFWTSSSHFDASLSKEKALKVKVQMIQFQYD